MVSRRRRAVALPNGEDPVGLSRQLTAPTRTTRARSARAPVHHHRDRVRQVQGPDRAFEHRDVVRAALLDQRLRQPDRLPAEQQHVAPRERAAGVRALPVRAEQMDPPALGPPPERGLVVVLDELGRVSSSRAPRAAPPCRPSGTRSGGPRGAPRRPPRTAARRCRCSAGSRGGRAPRAGVASTNGPGVTVGYHPARPRASP